MIAEQALGDLPGTPYRLVRLLDEGGMGQVYVAEHRELGRLDAVKVLSVAYNDNAQVLERLRREAWVLNRLSHPHVVELRDFGKSDDGRSYIAMRLVEGTDLRRYMKARSTPLTVEAAWALLRPIALALQGAHEAGIVHRDVKPQNIMVEPRQDGPFPVLLDFGVAHADAAVASDTSDRLTRHGQLLGTPNYMAPEQISGQVVDGRADQHALATVFYSLLCGRLPHERGDPLQVVARKILDEPIPLGQRAPGLTFPAPVEATIMRALSRRPADRFDTLSHFVEAFDRALEGRGFDAPDADSTLPGGSADLLVQAGPVVPGSLSTARGHLPGERDGFVGRSADLDALRALFVADARLVSVLGMAGTGKTRLAVRYATVHCGEWFGGVWFCDLSEAETAEDVERRMAAVLSVPLVEGDGEAQLAWAIAARGEALFVLDNFEQVVEAARSTLSRWLDRAPHARFLVTTRERLGLAGEHILALSPMHHDDAVALFLRRAKAARHDFEPTAEDLAHIPPLVELLDRLPLALELAAARVRVWTPRKILERMSDRFRLLTGGVGGPERQSTMRRALDWSWDLLGPDERVALAQACVFRGGFDLEAFEAVVLVEGAWPADLLQALVDRSLVRDVGGGRFDLLQTVFAYAQERIGSASLSVELRHGNYFAWLGSPSAIEALHRVDGEPRRRALRSELQNLLAAHARALTRIDAETAAGCARAAWAVLEYEGPFEQGVELLRTALLAGPLMLESELQTRLALILALRLSGDVVASETVARETMALALRGGRMSELGRVEANLAFLLGGQGRVDEARRLYDVALPRLREARDDVALSHVLGSEAGLCWEVGNIEQSEAGFHEALSIARRIGFRRQEGILYSNLGVLTGPHIHIEDRLAHYDAALEIHREVGNRRSEGITLGNRGNVYSDMGRIAETLQDYDHALTLHREVGNRRFEGITLGNLASLYATVGQPLLGRMNAEAAVAIHREIGNRRSEALVRLTLATLDLDEGQIASAERQATAAHALGSALGHRRVEGMAEAALGELRRQQGRWVEASQALERAVALLESVHDHTSLARTACSMGHLALDQGEVATAALHFDRAMALLAEYGATLDPRALKILDAGRQALEALGTPQSAP